MNRSAHGVTKRQLAARFVDALAAADQPLSELAGGLVAAAVESGYGHQSELTSLITMVEYELQARYGAVEVRLTTAHQLPADAINALAAHVAQAIGAHGHSTVHAVDTALLGGFEAAAGDTAVYDSIRFNLNALGANDA